jgi:hypothetical protein
MMVNDPRLTATSPAHRRKRHLAVYQRALRNAGTPAERAAVSERYRVLFSTTDSAVTLAS